MAEVNRREIYRYLGIKGQQEPDLQTKDLVEDCLEAVSYTHLTLPTNSLV